MLNLTEEQRKPFDRAQLILLLNLQRQLEQINKDVQQWEWCVGHCDELISDILRVEDKVKYLLDQFFPDEMRRDENILTVSRQSRSPRSALADLLTIDEIREQGDWERMLGQLTSTIESLRGTTFPVKDVIEEHGKLAEQLSRRRKVLMPGHGGTRA